MLSLLKNLWDSFDTEKRKNALLEQLEKEQRLLDADIEGDNNVTKTNIKNFISANNVNNKQVETGLDSTGRTEKSYCCKRTGIITSLITNHGTIDNGIFFDMDVALSVFNELKVGSRIEYLSFQKDNSEHIKVIKIEQVIDQYWDELQPTDENIKEQIQELRLEKPTYFNTQQRNILGLITERKRDAIIIDTDYKEMNINLDAVEIDFLPKEGDRVFVCCNVQMDEHFVDKQGEILQEVSVHPARMLKQEKCVVQRVHADWAVLNDDCYVTFDVLTSGCKLDVGDEVCADLIECERGEFVWRCIKLTVTQPKPTISSINPTPRAEKLAVIVSDNQFCVFSSTFQSSEVQFTITSRSDHPLKVQSLNFIGRKRESQVRLLEPETSCSFELAAGAERVLRFQVESKFYGETREVFVLRFDNFQIKRSIIIAVCETEEEVVAAKKAHGEAKAGQDTTVLYNRNSGQKSRYYANQVWSKKREIVPGVGTQVRRRFVAQRIGIFEVPERLRSAYLTSQNRTKMVQKIENMFPSLGEELSFTNYVQRFQTLLFLEEIDFFVSFRSYDRERAHFDRDGEYLSLTIENLSEKRPSLVLGDSLRAFNPWAETSDNRSYDGVIHKVLFNRILLKFNAGFQAKYNGEDYRLEFYFSRFSFRKQHFAVARIVKQLGQQFLFPMKLQLRERPQLDAKLDSDGNLYLGETLCAWHNPSLNLVQKRAISNILRGDAKNMPYIIFGPPGTGKTITLVETILQLVKQLPSARLLVGTPSNSSADLITTRLIDSGALQPGDFVRVVSQNQIEKDNIPEHLMPYCATVDIAADGSCGDSMIVTESGLKLRCQMKYLGRHRVSISTCATLGNFIQLGFPPNHFTHVLIDEAGQCTEPEVMVSICQLSPTRGQVVLAGDPQQLQSVVINRYATDRGLSLSFLERTLEHVPYLKDRFRFPETSGYDCRLVTKLLYNYRALPSILNVYSELFYNNELLPMVNVCDSREAVQLRRLEGVLPKSKTRPKMHGVFFYGMRSENMQEKDSPSWYNPLEAQNVFLMTIKLYRQNVAPESIGIITPYTKQVKHLRNIFITADIAMPKIGSVEEFQGQERDIIIISTVRSTKRLVCNDLRHALGFVQSSKRMNVAISRARYLMMVFGNPHLLQLDACWRSFIKYCVDNDAYSGCCLPEEFEEDREDDACTPPHTANTDQNS